MQKKTVTYGVYGQIEYLAEFWAGKARMRVLFEDGCTNSFGTRPATFTTDNPLAQAIIENSDDFRRGIVVKLS